MQGGGVLRDRNSGAGRLIRTGLCYLGISTGYDIDNIINDDLNGK